MNSQDQYRTNLVAHGQAITARLAETTPGVRAFIEQRKYQLLLYPLDFLCALIADAEAFEKAARAGAEAPPPEEPK
jgi:hypothetical protein